MRVKNFSTIQGTRWWLIRYEDMYGAVSTYHEGSFTSEEAAMEWGKENFIICP